MNNNKLYNFQQCYPTISEVKKIVTNYFSPNSEDFKVGILYVGMKSVIYLIETNTDKMVLKVAPLQNETMLIFENNNISWEAKMLKKLERLDIPSPKLLLFDDSKKIYQTPYFLMTYIKGQSFEHVKKEMSESSRKKIEEEIGKICAKICKIKSDNYFLPCKPELQFNSNYDFVNKLFEILICEAKKKNIIIDNVSYDDLLNLIKKFKNILNEVLQPSLTNVDAWEGNFIIDNDKVVGIVDFSDLYYCDELMTFYFHSISPNISSGFLKGYDKKLTENETIRTIIYRIWTLLKMIVEKEYKVSEKHLNEYEWLYVKFYDEIKRLSDKQEKLEI